MELEVFDGAQKLRAQHLQRTAGAAAADARGIGEADGTLRSEVGKEDLFGTTGRAGAGAAGAAAATSMEPRGADRGEEEETTVPLILAESGSGNGRASASGSAGEFYTVEQAIDHVGFGIFQIGIVTYVGLTWLADAAEMILLSFIGPAAKCEWQLSSVQEGAISSAVFVGVLVGAYSWGILSDMRGRRYAFLATALFTTVFGLLSAWSPTFWFLLIARTLVGFGLGGSSVAFSLCMEFLPTKGRGFWLVFLEAFWTVGSIAEAVLAWIIIPHINWRWLVAVSAVPFVLLLLFYPVLPESPRYLMIKGDEEGAKKVLQRIAKANGKPLPHGTLTTFVPVDSAPISNKRDGSPSQQDETEVHIAGNGKLVSVDPVESNRGIFYTLKLLFSPELKRSTLLLWFMFFANAFTYYGLVLLTTELQVKGSTERTCDDSSKLGADQCADGRPSIETSQYMTVLITSIAELPGLVVACLIVDKFGRKISLATLLVACGLFSLPLVTPLSELATNVLMFGSRSSIMGGFSVLWAYAPELYYTKVRATGVGAANSAGRLGGFLCPFVAVGLIGSCHRELAVGLFTVVPVLAGVATFLFPKEPITKRLKRAAPSLE